MRSLNIIFILILFSVSTVFQSCRHRNEGAEDEKDKVEHAEDIHWDDDDDHEGEYETADHINNSEGANISTNQSIPKEVLNSFNNKYVHNDNVNWREVDGEYEARFVQEDKELSARYNNQGKWQGTESVVDYEQLPQVIKESISRNNYSRDSIERLGMVESDEGNHYQLQYRQKAGESKTAEERRISIDSDGNLKSNN